MSDHQKVTIPLGGGLDRESGLLATNMSAMYDIRNVHFLNGRIEIRKGLERAIDFEGGTLLNVHPVRSRSMAAYLVLNGDGSLTLWSSAADGSGATALVDIPALEVTGSPRYVLADIYDKLFIAHDEPDILLRQPTRYWDFRTSDLHTMTMPVGFGGATVKFRGVAAHLSYMLGWGWGQGGDEDRAETLRISMPGDPTTFDPQHYFLVGLRGEPITGGGGAGAGWSIKKLTHGFRLRGTDRATFGVDPVEDHIGLPQVHEGVSVNGVYYFWSSDGPRRDTGGQSEDLSPGLRLLDAPPDAFAEIDTETGFAVYDPTRREVLFVFGRWAFVYHLTVNPERWSYREYGVPLGCGAVLYESTTGALVVPPDASYDFTLDPIGVLDEGPPDPGYDFTLDAI
jgi:hypothetical protein